MSKALMNRNLYRPMLHAKRPLLLALLLACAVTAPAQSLRLSPQLQRLPSLAKIDNTQRAADYIVAIVNSEPVTNNEVRARMVRLEQQLVQQGGAVPPRDELATQVLERLIGERAQLQFAREAGVRVDDLQLEAALEQIARSNQISIDQLRRRLESEGVGWTRFRADIRDELTLTRVREREVENRIRLTDQEVDQFIREQQQAPEAAEVELNLAQILVAVPERATPVQVQALQARAERALARVRAGEDFAAIVREYSDGGQAESGGQMGMRPADRYPQLFVDGTRSLRVGGVSGVVRSDAGFHILKVIDKRQGGALAVNVTQTRARHILLRPSPQLSESAAKERLAEARKRVAGGADFAALARELSQDGSAQTGGDLGWASPGQFVPEFEEVMSNLALNELSQPFVSRFGVHLVQVLERRQSALNQRDQRDIARRMLREQRTDEVFVQWSQEIRAKAYVEYREPPQ
jgi:peptidyl-prolyl cis-trans isomerase SurA